MAARSKDIDASFNKGMPLFALTCVCVVFAPSIESCLSTPYVECCVAYSNEVKHYWFNFTQQTSCTCIANFGIYYVALTNGNNKSNQW